jgi:hypothetical protein
MDIKESVEKRIEKTIELLNALKDKTTLTYLQGLHSIKVDCESISDFDKAYKYATIIIDLLQRNVIKYDDTPENQDLVNDIWVTAYDTKARQGDFESFCIAMEWNRPINKQFYLPRAKLLKKHGFVQAIQDLIDDKLDLLVLNAPPRVAKSTIGLFLQVLLGSISPDESILGAGHSVSLVQSFYSEILSLLTDEQYRYNKIFPNNKLVNKSAEQYYIDLNKIKRFHTFNYVSIESGGTGKVQAERLLYCDDLVKDVEQANSPDRLAKLYFNYTSTIKDRKIQRLCKDGVYRPCPELHICTPWSLHDVTSRVVNNAKESGDMSRVRIVSVPCYDEFGESNFEYDYGKGFNTQYYKDMEIAEDPVIFSAKYLMKPIERDGIVFSKDNVSFYNELPGEEPDRIIAYADPTHGGADFFSLPVGYVYGNEIYIEDILFENNFGGDDYIRPKICDIIIRNNVTRFGIEKPNGGDFLATLIENDLREKNYHCHITTHNVPTNKSKNDRILARQNEIKGIATENGTYRIYFKNLDLIKGNKPYLNAMRQLFTWNQNPNMQNKQHDDFPDSLAGMLNNVLNGTTNVAKVYDASRFGV